MGILELKYNDRVYTNPKKITEIIAANNFGWLIDSEVVDAVIEIEKNTLIWHSGIFQSGFWHYGIFKGGEFYGIFENGIFEDGIFDGKWESGINLKNN